MSRVVLLGASNVAIGFPSIVRQIAGGLPRPLELWAAFGHGRSYCADSRVLFRGLPGIDQCGLWDDLDRSAKAEPSPTLALLTDIGNDLLYGSAPAAVSRRVESCLARLEAHGAEIVVTRLPLASVARLSAWRYHATRTLFFPRTKTGWPDMLERARELDEHVAALAGRFAARLVELPLAWYGFDPIHIRRRRRHEAWRTIFSGWASFGGNGALPRLGPGDAIRLRTARPLERRLFGRAQRAAQPAFSWNGISIRLY